MVLQKFFIRLLPLATVCLIGISGTVYAIGHVLHGPLILAWVEPIQPGRHEGPIAYLSDPLRGLNIPIEPPFENSSFLPENFNDRNAEPGVLYLSEITVSSDNRTTVAQLYRYTLQTGQYQSIYKNVIQRQLLSYIPNYFLSLAPDGRHYAFWDSEQNSLVVIDTTTYTSQTIGQFEPTNRQDGLTGTVHWSPDGEKIAFFDSRSEIYIVNLKGEILNTIVVERLPGGSMSDVQWLPDNRHILFANLFGGSTANVIRIYDTITGDVHPFTSALSGINAHYMDSCQGKGDFISYTTGTDKETMFILDLSTGQEIAYDVNADEDATSGLYLSTDSNCQVVMYYNYHSLSLYPTSDVYVGDWETDELRKVLSDVYAGVTDEDNALIYAEQNADGTYNVSQLLLDGTDRTEFIAEGVPTLSSITMANILKKGWYIFQENDWTRTSEVMPPVRGNPVIYYDIHSHKARIATPPGVRIMYSWPIP